MFTGGVLHWCLGKTVGGKPSYCWSSCSTLAPLRDQKIWTWFLVGLDHPVLGETYCGCHGEILQMIYPMSYKWCEKASFWRRISQPSVAWGQGFLGGNTLSEVKGREKEEKTEVRWERWVHWNRGGNPKQLAHDCLKFKEVYPLDLLEHNTGI